MASISDLAFRIHIEPLKSINHATKVDTVLKVLSNIMKSYSHFLEVEILKNDVLRKYCDQNNNGLENIKNELELFIVDLNYGSFEAALAPSIVDLNNAQTSLFNNDVLDWEKATYNDFKETIVMGDYENPEYIEKIESRYTEEERFKIFHPLFMSVGDGTDYNLNLKSSARKIVKTIRQPDKPQMAFYVNKKPSERKVDDYKTAQVFLRVKGDWDGHTLTKKNIKDVLYYEEMEHDTYPFKTDAIRYGGKVFILSETMSCTVAFEDENYIITHEPLDITVWGETREEAEEAFRFFFYSLYLNFYLEADANLSDDAIALKNKLAKLITSVFDEAKEI